MAAANGDASSLVGEEFSRSLLAGYGTLFFAANPVSGASFLLGTFALAPRAGTVALLGLLAGTATARFLRRDPLETRSGLYGFNGALVGFGLLTLSGLGDLVYLWTLPSACVATWIQGRLIDSRFGRRWNLPTLSLPSLLVVLPLVGFLRMRGFGPVYSESLMPPWLTAGDLGNPALFDRELGTALRPIVDHWAVKLLFIVGFAVGSRRLLFAAVVGVVVAILVGYLGLGFFGAMHPVFVLATGAPVYVALAGLFTGGGLRAAVYGAIGVTVAFLAWFHLGLLFTDLELPALTLPFVVTTLALLAVLRIVGTRRVAFLPEALPLRRVGVPEAGAEFVAERRAGLRFWAGLGDPGAESKPGRSLGNAVERARALVLRSRRIVALTGAGVSTESGIPDYRSGAIAWKRYDTSHFTWDRFLASEESRRRYWEMSQDFYLVLRAAEPNAAHRAFVELDRQKKLLAIVTQNVDRLHQRAGVDPGKVIELHGNEHRVDCLWCGRVYSRDEVYRWIVAGTTVPYCPGCQGFLKPASTAFGQPMLVEESRRALEAVEGADLVIVAGTSLEVQPAASLPLLALREGIPVIVANLHATDLDPFADVVLRGKAGDLLPPIVAPKS